MPSGPSIARINRLPDNLVNRIAAGEVIERPASVVKELLENSIDAGATQIDVDIQRAGSRLLRITDNGHGIHVDDLALALERHTTSKLRQDADLVRIPTLGFRGEALSSIASVSRLSLISKWQSADKAWAVNLPVTGNAPAIRPASHPIGTTVEARDLFYNTPARRKFLRSEKTEFLHIQELVKRVALSRCDLKLRLQHNNRRLLQFVDDSNQPLRRVQAVLGNQFAARAITIDEQSSSISLHGWVAPPDYSRSQSDQQYIFLNGRIIRDKLVNHAIRLAYQDLIHPGRQPVYVLYLEMDLAAADINVHPTKQEVRFRDTRTVHDFIYGSLARHLGDPARVERITVAGRSDTGTADGREKIANGNVTTPVNDSSGQYNNSGAMHSLLQGRFILVEKADRLLLMDAHKARMLLASHNLTKSLEQGPLAAQPVLVPLLYKGDRQGNECLVAHAGDLAKLAIEIVPASPDAVQVRSLPRMLPYADILPMVKDLVAVLKRPPSASSLQQALLEQIAKHANDLAPQSMAYQEMSALLGEFLSSQMKLPGGQQQGVVREIDIRTMSEFLQRGDR